MPKIREKLANLRQNLKKSKRSVRRVCMFCVSALVLFGVMISCQNINVETETLQPPVISNGEADGRYTVTPSRGQSVTITDPNGGASIYYTLDGSTPTDVASASNFLYSGPIILSGTQDATTINARAFKENLRDSPVATKTFRLAWRQMSASLATGRMGHGVVEVDGKIYIIGGFTGNYTNPTNTCEVYNIATGEISDLGYPLNSARASFGIAVLNKKIYVIGGTVAGVPSNTIEVFDTQSPGNWDTLPDVLPVALDNLCAAVYGNTIYIFAGDDINGAVNSIYSYVPGGNPAAVSLSTGTYSGRRYFQVASFSTKILILGGSITTTIKDVIAFDPADLSITIDPPNDLSSVRKCFAAACSSSGIYLFGGCPANTDASKYSSASGEIPEFDMPVALEWPAASTAGSHIYVFGGTTTTPVKAIYRFTP